MRTARPTTELPISLNDVRAAAEALRGFTVRTPLLENAEVNARLGGRLLIKAECAQRTGAFKIRGACWRILNMNAKERARGVISYSSGNHAQGLARAAQLLKTSCLIAMPDDSPAQKVEATRALGAEIVMFNRDSERQEDVVERLRKKTGRIVVPPSADPYVLAGGGTVALELFEQAGRLGASPDAILTPCGGGGLTAATAIVARDLSPETRVFAVEPALFDDTRRSLEAGERLSNPPGRRTICDAIMTRIPFEMTFEVNRRLLAGGLVVSDAEVRAAMRFAFENYKIVVEPGAAVGIAAVLAGRIDISGRTIATVVTGGNVDPERFCELVKQGLQG